MAYNKYQKKGKYNESLQKQKSNFSFSFLLFVFFFFYIAYILISFISKKEVNYTVAKSGELSNSGTFTGLIIRDEVVSSAGIEGRVEYFLPEGARVRKGSDVVGIVKDEKLLELLQEKLSEATDNIEIEEEVMEETSKKVAQILKDFTIKNNSVEFAYSNKYEDVLKQELVYVNSNFLVQSSEYSKELLTLEKNYKEQIDILDSPRSGIVSYNVDGFEALWIDNFDYSRLEKLNYDKNNQYKKSVKKDESVFKTVDNYLWYIAVKINDECEKQIEGEKYIDIYLGKNKEKLIVKVNEIKNRGDNTYVMLEVDRRIQDFLQERVVNVKIAYKNYDGLKIPKSAVVTKKFVKIPFDFITEIDSKISVLVEPDQENAPKKPHTVNIYKVDGDYAFIPMDEVVKDGATVYKVITDNSIMNDQFTINEVKEFDGVFVVNKGYTVFKLIDEIYHEDDFIIVKEGTSYGIKKFDRIVTDSRNVEENEILKR